jgi:hypothetical protein
MRLQALLLVAALPTFALAQAGHSSSLALHWTHAWGEPYIHDNVASSESAYGAVDQISHVWFLDYVSPEVTLTPGSYAARVRLQKVNSDFGRRRLNLSASAGGVVLAGGFLPPESQPVGQWTETHALIFNVAAGAGPITFRFGNTDTLQDKRGYEFDSFTVKPLPLSLSCATFSYANPSYFTNEATPESAFGTVKRLNQSLTWLYGGAGPQSLPPGVYAMKLRVKFTSIPSAFGWTSPQDLHSYTSINGVATDDVIMLAADQPTDAWFETPPLIFTVSDLGSTTTPAFGNTIFDEPKGGYEFDRLEIAPVDAQTAALVQNRQATHGSTLTMDVFAPGAPGALAVTAWSATTSTGVVVGDGRTLALDLDWLFLLSITPGNGVFSGELGVIDSQGRNSATPSAVIPDLALLAGVTLYGGVVTLDAATLAVVGSSPAVAVTIF